jgi:hypothetical protein
MHRLTLAIDMPQIVAKCPKASILRIVGANRKASARQFYYAFQTAEYTRTGSYERSQNVFTFGDDGGARVAVSESARNTLLAS